MKYEDFQQAEKFVSQIKKYQKTLDELNNSGNDMSVLVKDVGGSIFYNIPLKLLSEHDYTELGRKFIDSIKEDLQKKIDNLKSELEQL
jgi:hypothetical protein